jgi:hypothetical protein
MRRLASLLVLLALPMLAPAATQYTQVAPPFYPIQAGETGVVLTRYPVGNVLRYGADSTGAADSSAAFTNACAASKSLYVPFGTSGAYTFSSAPTLTGCALQTDAGVIYSGAGSAGTFVNGIQQYGNYGLGPSGVGALYSFDAQSHGDNTTFRGLATVLVETRDDGTVTALNKGVLYGIRVQVVPTQARNNVPFDDADGITIANTTGTAGAKATDALYFAHNNGTFGATSDFFAVISADMNADVAGQFAGRYATRGIDFANANLPTSVAFRMGNGHGFYARNAGNTADLSLMKLDANNILQLGDSSTSGVQVKNSWFGVSTPTVVSVTTYTVVLADNYIIFNSVNTLTLPNAGSFPGRVLNLKTTGSAVTSASSNVTPLVGGAAGTAILSGTAGKWAVLVSDGALWQTMSAN